MRTLRTEEVFVEIYRTNAWGGKESVSGGGSDIDQTRVVEAVLPGMLRELGVRTMLDIPCGDFHWMSRVDLSDVDYLGADIVDELVAENNARYASGRVRFRRLDLIRDPLPRVDLIFCRDCLVHLASPDVEAALVNIAASGSDYLLTTTFPAHESNPEIVTGEWRPLNLEISPLALRPPLRLVNEGCTEGGGAYSDKSLGLWRVADLARRWR